MVLHTLPWHFVENHFDTHFAEYVVSSNDDKFDWNLYTMLDCSTCFQIQNQIIRVPCVIYFERLQWHKWSHNWLHLYVWKCVPNSTNYFSIFDTVTLINLYNTIIIWATSWQNQQCGCAPSEDSDQPGHPPSLIRVFAVRMKKAWVLSYPLSAQRRLWSDWADAQADLSLCWAHSHFVGFVMRWLNYVCTWLCISVWNWKSLFWIWVAFHPVSFLEKKSENSISSGE